MTTRAIVVGAGIGGLSTAIRLQNSGIKVTVLEQRSSVGGRCSQLILDDYKFDTGPTLLMMVDELRDLFNCAGKNQDDYIELIKLDPHSCFRFFDNQKLLLTSNKTALAENFDNIESGAGEKIKQWLNDHQELYKVGMREFIDRDKPNYLSALNPQNLSFFLKGQVTAPIYSVLSRYFNSEKLKDVIAFSALYLGMNPYETPSIYSLLPYAELAEGLYFPRGGMYEISKSIEKLALELGVEIELNSEVSKINHGSNSIESVILKNGTQLEADLYVVNADLPFAYKNLLNSPHPSESKFEFSCSAYLLFLGIKNIPSDFYHHQCIIPESFKKSMDDIFDSNKIPDDPAYYICCPSLTDPTLAPKGHHCLSVLVPVPSCSKKINWEDDRSKLKSIVLKMLCTLGIKSEDIVVQHELTPKDLGSMFSLVNDAAFGLSHKLNQIGPFRPENKHQQFENLYFVGASTHPGNGIPMVLKSGKLAANRIMKEIKVPNSNV